MLAQYVNQGVGELDQDKLASLVELKYHSIANAADELGGAGHPGRFRRLSAVFV